MQYKTKDYTIISAVTQGKVIPEDVSIAQIDTSVQSLLSTNPYQGSGKTYSGEIMDMTYTSTLEQHNLLTQTIERVGELKAERDQYLNTDDKYETFP